MRDTKSRRLIGVAVGVVLGFVVGAIVAVNVVITAGVDRGYEASIPEIFEENTLVGVATVIILAAGPIVGGLVALRVRRRGETHSANLPTGQDRSAGTSTTGHDA